MTTRTPRETAAHEIGHAIEWQIPGVHARVAEFLDHRCGGEAPRRMADVAPEANYDPSEIGRKDHFDRAFSEAHAYYIGKVCSGEASEVLSMGVQKLFTDPAGFARNDPEFCKLVLGVLDGSIR